MTTQSPGTQQQDSGGSALKPGIYRKCRGVEGSAKPGFSSKDSPEITLDVTIPDLAGRRATVVLYLTAEATKFTLERLRALGWKGNDIREGYGTDKFLTGISTQDVDIEITYEMYEGKARPKVQIMGGGTFETRKPVSENGGIDAWAAKVSALSGIDVTGGKGPTGGGPAPKPDF
jgi:hypothetical protein